MRAATSPAWTSLACERPGARIPGWIDMSGSWCLNALTCAICTSTHVYAGVTRGGFQTAIAIPLLQPLAELGMLEHRRSTLRLPSPH